MKAMEKKKLKRVIKRIIISILISCVVYLLIAFTLVYWPIPGKKDMKNYDYSSLKKHPGNPSTPFKEWITTRDGYQLFSRIYKSESKDVMILIHGSGAESRYLAVLADSLAKANIATVLTPDLRGHGANSGARGDIDFIGQLENDLEDMIQFCKKRLGAKKIILAGHSSGGGFVLRFIGNPANSKVDEAILLAPYLGHDAPAVKPKSGGWVSVAMKRIIGLSMLNNAGIKKFNSLPVLFFNRPEHIKDQLQVPSYSFNMTINFNPKNYKTEIKKIAIPCLVLVGAQDESFYPELVTKAFEPAGTFVTTAILDSTTHLGIVNNQRTLQQIKAWIKFPFNGRTASYNENPTGSEQQKSASSAQ